MKILFLLETNWITRGPAQHHHLLERLQQRGHEVRVIDFDIEWTEKLEDGLFAPRKSCKVPNKATGIGTTSLFRPSMIRAPLLSYATMLPNLVIETVRQIKSFQPDLLMGEGVLNVYVGEKIAHFYGIPFLRYILDADETAIPERILRPFGKLLVSEGVKNADKVVVINELLARYAIRMGADTKPEVVTAGIDPNRFNPDVDGSEIRAQLGFDETDIVLFFMGYLYEFSGLIEVAREIQKCKNSRVCLLVLGRGDIYHELKNIESNTQNNRIKIESWVPYKQVPIFVAAADICILPARLNKTMRDIVPIKMYEYLACGKPVISTYLPGVVKEFGKGSGVVYVEKPKKVVQKAVEISENRNLYSMLQSEAISFSKGLGWDCITNQFERILLSLI